MATFSFEGRLIYRGKFCLVEVPKDIVHYYIQAIKQTWGVKLNSSYHGAHVTVIDGRKEDCTKHRLWAKDHGKKVKIEYGGINNKSKYGTGEYWWLNVANDYDLSAIRHKFGLKPRLFWDFHLTIGYNNT